MSDNLLNVSTGHAVMASERILPSNAQPYRAPQETGSIPVIVAALSNSWLWIAIGLASLWLMSNGG